jgi:16S rRNA (guanine966-N2)-methyltransferase
MRISGGLLKGRKLGPQKAFSKKGKEDALRPTSSKVREALFDILRSKMEGAAFLDLFAGTGTVGVEALSRGAATVYFVEDNPMRCRVIRDFLAGTGLADRAFVHTKRALDFLKEAARKGMTFGIIFADPPYGSGETDKVLPLIDTSSVLAEGGSVIVEHSSKMTPCSGLQSLRVIRSYRYGDTMLTLYRKER